MYIAREEQNLTPFLAFSTRSSIPPLDELHANRI